ncbi:unnamed protein product [Adineta ricciae]|uniref:LolA-like domain-containing protein n=1 Tax=Adineta ricciae TaxID=249248 RepID=A0A814RD74_ADIRI|nr:unnamed protein product [Adineta ricciae]CAF1340431.1 unnamed protein product [Adineta ricciae]
MKQYQLFCLLVLCISKCLTQDPTTTPSSTWNGDPAVCTVDTSTPPVPDRPLPRFPTRVEFALERVEVKHILDITVPSEITMYQYLYDFEANKLILIKNSQGIIDVEYFYYEALKKSTYLRREICLVSDIDTNLDMDGTSAIQGQNNTWHIRPLNEFLLFSSNDPRRPEIRPKFIGQSMVRGIPVDQWETCIIDKSQFRTYRRVWSFAQKGFILPTGVVGDFAVPIQAIINASISFPNGTQAAEVDEIFNIHNYRPGIVESSDQLTPPKGVFCDSGLGQNLISLRDAGITWPDRFTVRVEASSSRSAQWQRFHLRYDHPERGPRRIHYDFLPPGSEHYQSIIHDFGDNLTYTIDHSVGTCKITRGTESPDVDPIVDPIGFFIKNERRFIYRERERIWEFNGYRPCRGDTIRCAAVTSSVDKFPPIVDVDTGKPSGDTWDATSIEYGWSVRAPYARPPSERNKHFDYPVYLFLRMYRFNDLTNPSITNMRTEDIEYEFYEMSPESNPRDFDTSLCYRSLHYDYLHLGFKLEVSDGKAIDGSHLDRRLLERQIHSNLAYLTETSYSRISEVQVDHEDKTNEVTVLFTLLGQTPSPGTVSGVVDSEPKTNETRGRLARAIDEGKFDFIMKLLDDTSSSVHFQAVRGSLKGSKEFMSSHAVGKQVFKETYSSGAEAGAVIGGILVGLLIGILLAAVFRVVRKEPMPDVSKLPASISNPLSSLRTSTNLPSISFHKPKSAEEKKTTSDA